MFPECTLTISSHTVRCYRLRIEMIISQIEKFLNFIQRLFVILSASLKAFLKLLIQVCESVQIFTCIFSGDTKSTESIANASRRDDEGQLLIWHWKVGCSVG